MNATDIVGYAYNAALHCPDCAADSGREKPDALDDDGNPVGAVFCGSDAAHGTTCDDCGASLDGYRPAEVKLLLDDCRGIYIPRDFARTMKRECVLNVTPADFDELEKGPDQEWYWDLWQEVCDAAVILEPDTGTKYTLYQDGALFMVEQGAEMDDMTGEWRIAV